MTEDRLQALIARLAIVRNISLGEAMELLSVSESTARRMFAQLEHSGAAIRTHGGIRSIEQTPTAYSFEFGAKMNIKKKSAIGSAACDFLEDGDVIFCDSGTTIQCFCAELVHRLRRDKLNITVYTNSLANVELLSPYLPVHLTGGTYRSNRKDFCGYIAEQTLRTVYFTKCFVGADGCIDGNMFTTTDFDTMRVNEVAIGNSRQTYMLVDSTKFSVSTHIAYMPIEQIHTVITDDGISKGTLANLKKTSANIVCVNTK